MLTDTLCRTPRREGLHLVQRATELASWRLRLRAGGEERYCNPDEETVLVLQEGRSTLGAAGESWKISRKSVFAERATALYLPPGVELTVKAESPLEAILISAKDRAANGKPVLVGPDEVVVNQRGKGNYSREVHDIFVRDPHVRRLMVGETFNPPGNWSSYPPHKHDGRNGEPRIEEVYHYRIDPPNGFGNQMIYTNDGESITHQVHDGDAVLVPYGYHPVSAAPGYRLYYLWGMAGEERRMALYEDPSHSWIHQS